MTRRAIFVGLGLVFCPTVISAQQTNAQATYTLKATPKTVAWGDITTRRRRRSCM